MHHKCEETPSSSPPFFSQGVSVHWPPPLPPPVAPGLSGRALPDFGGSAHFGGPLAGRGPSNALPPALAVLAGLAGLARLAQPEVGHVLDMQRHPLLLLHELVLLPGHVDHGRQGGPAVGNAIPLPLAQRRATLCDGTVPGAFSSWRLSGLLLVPRTSSRSGIMALWLWHGLIRSFSSVHNTV